MAGGILGSRMAAAGHPLQGPLALGPPGCPLVLERPTATAHAEDHTQSTRSVAVVCRHLSHRSGAGLWRGPSRARCGAHQGPRVPSRGGPHELCGALAPYSSGGPQTNVHD